MDSYDLDVPYGTIRSYILLAAIPLLFLTSMSTTFIVLLLLLTVFLITGSRPYWLYILKLTYRRDLWILRVMAVCVANIIRYDISEMTVAKMFNKFVKKHPDKIAFHTESKSWTFKEISDLSNRASHMFKKAGVTKEHTVGLMLSGGGGAELPALWLGTSILRAPAALLPPQLTGSALLHSLVIAKIDILLYSDDLYEVIKDVKDNPDLKHIRFFQYNLHNANTPMLENATSVNDELKEMPTTLLTKELAAGCYKDKLIYIYTSGTTGLPKAAVISNTRYLMVAVALNKVTAIRDDDIMYTPLPLHHTAGAMLGLGQTLCFGLTITLRKKFSATNFWKDCVKYKCTIAQYIGEICRFLIVAAEKSGESDPAGPHCLRFMVGNGLRTNIWEKFQNTFRIPHIYELYGATEGNTNMMNFTSKIGAVGFVPRYAFLISPIVVVKCDQITGEPLKNENGFCIPCKPCEPGLMLGKLNQNKRLYEFTGYVDKDATKKKIMRDVLKKGDSFFNSGDILVMDHLGYYYFKDRTGDTFRWRGENVSTAEVENIISEIIGLTDTVVFGVKIPEIEGRAGMAAIVDRDNKLDFSDLKTKMDARLPHYAHPIFLRIITTLDLTSTFKIIKRHMQAEAFDITKFDDKVFFLDPKTKSYVPLTLELYNNIVSGKIRL